MANRKELKLKLERFEDELNPFQEKLYQSSAFLAKLLLVGLIFRGVLWIYPSTTQIQSAYAGFLTYFMNLFGAGAVHNGIDIHMGSSTYRIIQDCLGWKSMMMFTGLMFASSDRTNIRNNLKYLIAGLALIQAGNIVRILSTIYLAESGTVSFEVIHGILWSWGLAVLVFAIWIYWIKYLQPKNKEE